MTASSPDHASRRDDAVEANVRVCCRHQLTLGENLWRESKCN